MSGRELVALLGGVMAGFAVGLAMLLRVGQAMQRTAVRGAIARAVLEVEKEAARMAAPQRNGALAAAEALRRMPLPEEVYS